MATISSDLKAARGFGLTDPVPMQRITAGTRGNRGEPAGHLSPETELEVLSERMVIHCPMARGLEVPTSTCRTCPHFSGVSEVPVSGTGISVERRHRIQCAHPKRRKLGASSAQKHAEFTRSLEKAIRSRQGDVDVEMDTFVRETRSVNCPIARTKTGIWRVEGAPCPLCEHYRGLVLEKRFFRKPVARAILCAHLSTLQFRSVVSGAAVFEV